MTPRYLRVARSLALLTSVAGATAGAILAAGTVADADPAASRARANPLRCPAARPNHNAACPAQDDGLRCTYVTGPAPGDEIALTCQHGTTARTTWQRDPIVISPPVVGPLAPPELPA